MSEFENRVVLVTGASGGLGTATTEAFLKIGAIVAGVARAWKGRAPRHERFSAVDADLTRVEGAHTAVAAALRQRKQLDAVIHVMGGFAGGKLVEQTDDAMWEHMMNLNARSAFYLFREALPYLRATGRGRIVAVGSRAGQEPGAALSAYSASKAALHTLVRAVAAEGRNFGVTANVVMPSIIDTPDNRAAMPEADTSAWVRPESVAGLLVWLASDAAADVNGALIPIYGRA